jgi:hypothetical protein
VFLIDAAHQGGSWGKNLVDEDEDRLLGRELDALADNVDELANCEICWDQVFLLVDSCDVGFFDFLADDLHDRRISNAEGGGGGLGGEEDKNDDEEGRECAVEILMVIEICS